MREDMKKTLCDLQERALNDIKKLLEKPDISPTEWKSAGEAVDIIKDVEASIKDALTTEAMQGDFGESERGSMNYRTGVSYGYYPMGESFAGASMRRGRSSYGGGNSYGGNSYAGGSSYGNGSSYGGSSYGNGVDSMVSNLRNLMNTANSENERMIYQRFIEEAEHMR